MTLVEFLELCIDRVACGACHHEWVMLDTCNSLGLPHDLVEASLQFEPYARWETVDDRIASLQNALKLARERNL